MTDVIRKGKIIELWTKSDEKHVIAFIDGMPCKLGYCIPRSCLDEKQATLQKGDELTLYFTEKDRLGFSSLKGVDVNGASLYYRQTASQKVKLPIHHTSIYQNFFQGHSR